MSIVTGSLGHQRSYRQAIITKFDAVVNTSADGSVGAEKKKAGRVIATGLGVRRTHPGKGIVRMRIARFCFIGELSQVNQPQSCNAHRRSAATF